MIIASNQITLPDGRKLAYAEHGDPNGTPVLYFHGAPACRLEPELIGDEVWRRLGLRVIAPDRPGMGESDWKPARRLADWPSDVLQLADALGLANFNVLGNSGGGPYVAVCAAKIPERIDKAVIVSGGWRMDWPEARDQLPFINRLVMTFARRAPFLLRLLFKMMGSISQGDREKELAQMKGRMPPADYAAFAEPGRVEAFGAMMKESMRQSTRGPVWEMGLYVRDFGFDPGEISIPVTWFHGELDANSPIQLARKAANSIPNCKLVTFPYDAHLSTLTNHIEEIGGVLKEPRK